MNGRDLSNRLLYTGMIRDARKLAFKDKMASGRACTYERTGNMRFNRARL